MRPGKRAATSFQRPAPQAETTATRSASSRAFQRRRGERDAGRGALRMGTAEDAHGGRDEDVGGGGGVVGEVGREARVESEDEG